MMRKPQISASVSQEVQEAVNQEAKRDNRSFSETVELLLQQAIKERERQRNKNRRKSPTEQY
jgi:hypothetical protein